MCILIKGMRLAGFTFYLIWLYSRNAMYVVWKPTTRAQLCSTARERERKEFSFIGKWTKIELFRNLSVLISWFSSHRVRRPWTPMSINVDMSAWNERHPKIHRRLYRPMSANAERKLCAVHVVISVIFKVITCANNSSRNFWNSVTIVYIVYLPFLWLRHDVSIISIVFLFLTARFWVKLVTVMRAYNVRMQLRRVARTKRITKETVTTNWNTKKKPEIVETARYICTTNKDIQ